jgi:hypothetical protein
VVAAQRGEVSSWLLTSRAAGTQVGGQDGGARGRSPGAGSVDLGGRLGELFSATVRSPKQTAVC